MSRFIVASLLAVTSLAVSAPVEAQRRTNERRPVPDAGMVAVAGSISVAVPTAPDLSAGWDIAVSAERYFTPRLSLRGQLGGGWADITGHSFNGTSNPVRLDGNVVYNWEHGGWHPHVTAGAGLYRFRFVENDRFHADNELGADLGGGAEYYLSRRDSLTGEVLFHYIPGRVTGQFATYDPRFWTLAAGYKKYF